jgi:kinesin family protein 3/17
MMEIMERGSKNKHMGETAMNRNSSRSHSIFTITIENCSVEADGEAHIRVGKFNMVDLAGSEKQSKTGAQGERLEEAIKINLSLSTLCNVISALVDNRSKYVPYRDSKLTRLLQDSLGGNTKTVMIANIGPADYNTEETINTLRYANRAKRIENKPRINEDPKDAMLREFQDEIQRLKEQLKMAAGSVQIPEGARVEGGKTVVEVEKIVHVEDKEKMKKLEKRLAKERQYLQKKHEEEKNKLVGDKNLAEEEKQKLMAELDAKLAEEEKEKAKQQKLLKRLKNMEEKVLQGTEQMKEAMKQEMMLQ